MAVHHSGALAPVAGDLQITHQGAQIALKSIDWGGGLPVLALIEKKPEGWVAGRLIWEFDDSTPAIIERAGGMIAWIKSAIVPRINDALAARFKPSSSPPPVTLDPDAPLIDQFDAALLGLLAWAPQPDGSLKVVVK